MFACWFYSSSDYEIYWIFILPFLVDYFFISSYLFFFYVILIVKLMTAWVSSLWASISSSFFGGGASSSSSSPSAFLGLIYTDFLRSRLRRFASLSLRKSSCPLAIFFLISSFFSNFLSAYSTSLVIFFMFSSTYRITFIFMSIFKFLYFVLVSS